MRLFVGLRPSEEFRAALSVLQSRLQSAGVAARYLDPSNLHLTLAFIGEWPENVSAILPPVEQPFTLTLAAGGLHMKATGIVRRIDDLGRVVIPKEIRRTLRIREGDPLLTTLTVGNRAAFYIMRIEKRMNRE